MRRQTRSRIDPESEPDTIVMPIQFRRRAVLSISVSPVSPVAEQAVVMGRKLAEMDLQTRMQYLRKRMLARARCPFQPLRQPLPQRRIRMSVVYWEVFGKFGTRREKAITPRIALANLRRQIHLQQARQRKAA